MTSRTERPDAVPNTDDPGRIAQQPSGNNVIELPARGEGSIEGDRPFLVEPGYYDLWFLYHETACLFRTGKLILHFQITSPVKVIIPKGYERGDVRVARYFNAKIKAKTRRRGGAFTVGWKSDFLREYTRLFGSPPSKRLSTDPFRNRVIRGLVTTVSKSGKKDIPKDCHYSVVSQIVEVMS